MWSSLDTLISCSLQREHTKLTFGFAVCFMCRVRSSPRCLQPVTFPVSMMAMVSTSGPHVQRKMIGTAFICRAFVWYGPDSAIHQNLLSSLATSLMFNPYPSIYFFPNFTSWYRFWSCNFTHLLDIMVKVGFHYTELTYWKNLWNCYILTWRIYSIAHISILYCSTASFSNV